MILQADFTKLNLKRMILFLAVIAALVAGTVPTTVAQSWEVMAFPSAEQLTGIYLLGSDTVYVVGGSGRFFRTFDQGGLWEDFPVSPTTPLEDLYFFNADTGFICGRGGGIFMTTDAGYNWINKSISDTTPWFVDLEMFDRKNGIVIGATREPENPVNGISLQTTDGGKTWNRMPPMGMGFSQAGAIPGQFSFFVSFGQLHISRDGGKTWEIRATHDGSPARAISFKGKTGIMAGPNGMVQYSNDTGKTWLESKQGFNTVFIGAELVNEKVGYVGGVNSPILRTEDGGKSWVPESGTERFQVFDIFASPSHVWIVGTKGLIARKEIK